MNPRNTKYYCLAICFAIAMPLARAASAQEPAASRPAGGAGAAKPVQSEDMTQVSLEDLMTMEVSSVSKQKEKLSDAAAAIFVITNEDLRRSGVRSIPEALRMVPGLDLARINANSWAISSRGFNDQFSNKMLVLVDGRTVYTGLFSGVYWDVQDYPLNDIDRIEVIRGPGGTLWGSNAVNGVINIITKKAADTQGGFVQVGGGSEDHGFGTLRYGGKLGENSYYRIYGKYFDKDGSRLITGGETPDDWHLGRGGFRTDTNISKEDALTVQGDMYRGSEGVFGSRPVLAPPFAIPFTDNTTVEGENVLARWEHTNSKTSDFAVQMYYDTMMRSERADEVRENTLDFDFQHHIRPLTDHSILWGLGYRLKDTFFDGVNPISFHPTHRSKNLESGFVQDTINLSGEKLKLTIGTKLEVNEYTGLEVQPSARIAWNVNEKNTLWAAVSRAVRTPAPVDRDLRVNLSAFPFGGGVAESAVFGNRDIKAEELIAYEIGYRTKPSDSLFIDIAAFFNSYNHLRSNEQGAPFAEATPAPAHSVIPLVFQNNLSGYAYGIEVAANWTPAERLRFQGGYSFLNIELHRSANSNDTSYLTIEGSSPENQVFGRVSADVARNVEFDVMAKYVDRLPEQSIRGYVKLDARIAWHPSDNIEIILGAVNLVDTTHREFGTPTIETPSLMERAVYAALTIRF